MISKKVLVIALAIAFIGLVSTTDMFSQRKGMRGNGENCGNRPNKELKDCPKDNSRDSMRAVMKEKVLPELTKIKNSFDSKLSKNDLTALNELRSGVEAMINTARMKAKENRPARGSKMTDEDRAAFKERKDEFREKMDSFSKDLDAIIEKNSALVGNLTVELQTVADKYDVKLPFGGGMHSKRPNMMHKKMKCDSSCKKECPTMKIDKNATEKFLLWNGNADTFDKEIPVLKNSSAKLKNYPNPFYDKTTISVVMPKSETVTIDLYDNSGNLLGQIFNGTLNEGENSVEFNSSSIKGLNPGVLVYKIKSTSLNTSGKMLFKK